MFIDIWTGMRHMFIDIWTGMRHMFIDIWTSEPHVYRYCLIQSDWLRQMIFYSNTDQ